MPCGHQAVPLVERLGLPSSCGAWRIRRLSTGEKQRLGLVRSLLLQSRVLLLDEPRRGSMRHRLLPWKLS